MRGWGRTCVEIHSSISSEMGSLSSALLESNRPTYQLARATSVQNRKPALNPP